jgi:phage tail-like protein
MPRIEDPPFSGTFTVHANGIELGSFAEVSGLSVKIETEDLVEGGLNGLRWHLPKGMSWPNIVLKRGLTKQDSLMTWLKESSGDPMIGGQPLALRAVTISLMDVTRQTYRSWALDRAYPIRWSGPRLAASTRDVATEELELAHHGFTAT